MDYKTDKVWLMQGDCLDRMKDIPDSSVDLILADIPYGTTRNKWDTVIELKPMWAEIWRVLKPKGCVALFAAQPFTSLLVSSQFKHYKYEWIWEKNLKTGNLNAKIMPMGGHESIQVFYKKTPKYFPQKRKRVNEVRSGNKYNSETSNYGTQKSEYTDNQSDTIHPDTIIRGIPCLHNSAGKIHPTQKPIALMQYFIRTYTEKGDTVLDFTMGSGSTVLGALELERAAIGIENGLCERTKSLYYNQTWVDVVWELIQSKEEY